MSRKSDSRLPGFYKLSVAERREMLQKNFGLNNEVMEKLANGLEVDKADLMVENVVGVFGLPLGLAPNFLLDGEPVVVPMAVEEPSVVAACAHVAKLLSTAGGISTQASASLMTGQIQILDYPESLNLDDLVREHQTQLVAEANRFCPGLHRRGGGCKKVAVHHLDPLPPEHPHYIPDELRMGVLHFTIDCLDAMGANAVNTVVEGVAPLVEELTKGKVLLRILSNLSDHLTGFIK